ncbi:hypothetical protein QBC34DRAFT_496178 [Podospora aff. communis PSN243]|uniref:Uncharacterized protein n=1 Tax=Podospora aff. communis PSN243 TaxID=3040156 RepID=A0AAV9GFU0_9PEZI|nr:hypothetical protein QBC34DRAFT_496178 [Podospora aff. communis PSN243]
MDLGWKTSKWTQDGGSKGSGRTRLLRYHPGRAAYAVQISRQKGDATPEFNKDEHCCPIKNEKDWNDWLDSVPQPDSTAVEASLSLVVCPRHPDTPHDGGTIRNPASLSHLPFPNDTITNRLAETLHIHQALKTIINRGWPIILRSEDLSGPDPIFYYNLRTTNTLENDTALSLAHIPAHNLTYALLLGYTDSQIDSILSRLTYAEHAVLSPFTLINTFIQLEKVQRFEQVERHADEMADLIKNFQRNAATAPAKMKRPVHEDDPRDLVGLAAEMRLLRNGLVSWARELGRFRERLGGDFERCVGGDEKLPLLDAGEYLDRTVDEYEAMVRKCEGMLEQVSMTFQMETSSIARQEVNKMKALAILTMVFLPATFVATFMSMGLFDWHPEADASVMSPYWWVYFAVAGGLTLFVFLLYFFWSPITHAWSLKKENSEVSHDDIV